MLQTPPRIALCCRGCRGAFPHESPFPSGRSKLGPTVSSDAGCTRKAGLGRGLVRGTRRRRRRFGAFGAKGFSPNGGDFPEQGGKTQAADYNFASLRAPSSLSRTPFLSLKGRCFLVSPSLSPPPRLTTAAATRPRSPTPTFLARSPSFSPCRAPSFSPPPHALRGSRTRAERRSQKPRWKAKGRPPVALSATDSCRRPSLFSPPPPPPASPRWLVLASLFPKPLVVAVLCWVGESPRF